MDFLALQNHEQQKVARKLIIYYIIMLDRTTDFYVKGNATQTTSNKNSSI